MEKICLILMATYNGCKYISKQIESIINQTYNNWHLIIRDDGSTDGTIEVIDKFIHQDSRISLLQNESEDHGSYLNFWSLINYAYEIEEYDYYFFSDQDDIWAKDKLEKMINFAESKEQSKPMLVYSDMAVIDGHDVCTLKSINKVMGIGQMNGLTEFYSSGFVWGCATMINKALFFKVPPLNLNFYKINIMSHDNFYTKLALIVGNVYFIDETLIMHRRHSSNVTKGNSFGISIFKAIKRGLFSYRDLSRTHAIGYAQTLITIEHMMNNNINSEIINEIQYSINKGGYKGIKILKKYKVQRFQRLRTWGIYIIFFFKSYKKPLKNILSVQK